ncbi:hypothetical protein B5X24_HaOG206925 [Helicoverpa armigera]|nr:hypothetical protein B5X24_HaOG206925 [Helicoverpa armigera]
MVVGLCTQYYLNILSVNTYHADVKCNSQRLKRSPEHRNKTPLASTLLNTSDVTALSNICVFILPPTSLTDLNFYKLLPFLKVFAKA